MNRLKILTVVGARPQFIKTAMVSHALRGRTDVRDLIVHTGQHYDKNMSNIFFNELDIPKPDYNLGIGSATQGVQTGKMLEAIEHVLINEKPKCVVVYGDTNSTLAGALAAIKLHIPVVHVEAGLRSFNRRMPEEINRILTDHVSDLLLAPTKTAVKNLMHEGFGQDRVFFVGDVMYDAALFYAKRAEANSSVLERLGLASNGYILATIHRAENTDNPKRLSSIFEAFSVVSKEVPVVIPMHPRTQAVLQQEGSYQKVTHNIYVVDPVGYLDMVMLEKNSLLIATDSGGVQKEAFFYKVPCVTLRDETEWTELVEMGWNRVVSPTSYQVIVEAIENALSYHNGSNGPSPYGDGTAATKITQHIINTIS
jgi:UDP-GlcNAc3NAcA epimerase